MLSHLSGYHSPLSSAVQQPICWSSANPHLVIKKVLEELLHTPTEAPCHDETSSAISPLGLVVLRNAEENTSQKKRPQSRAITKFYAPLREKYLPKRRVSKARNTEPACILFKPIAPGRLSPPPTKWSPEHSELVMWSCGRPVRSYLAPQPQPKRQYIFNPSWGSTHEEKYEHALGYGYDPLIGAIHSTCDYKDPLLW